MESLVINQVRNRKRPANFGSKFLQNFCSTIREIQPEFETLNGRHCLIVKIKQLMFSCIAMQLHFNARGHINALFSENELKIGKK